MRKKTNNPQIVEERTISSKWINIGLMAALIILQGILIYPLFFDGYSRFVENIEAAHLSNAGYILNHFGEKWNSLWYNGFPTHLTYPPVMPNLVALVTYLTKLNLTHVYRIITAIFLMLTPVSVYMLAKYLTKRKTTAFLASVFYILLPSVAYLFIPQLAMHIPLAGYAPFRLITFAQYGEGPHLASVFFLPLALMYFIKSYRQPDVKNYILAAIFTALTMLTNLFGGVALLMLFAIVVLGKLAIYVFTFSIKRLLVVGALSYALTAFAFDLGFVQSIIQSSYIHPENSIHLPPFLVIFVVMMFGILPIALLVRGKMMGNDENFKWFLAIVWTLVFLTIPTVYYHSGYALMSQPNRYLPELQIGFSIFTAMLVTVWWDLYPANEDKMSFTKKTVSIIATFVVLTLISYSYISKPYYLINPQPMDVTYEYKIAEYLDENIDKESGERTYLTGTPAFWLTAFYDVPQIRGSADNAQSNPWWADISYQINQGEDAQVAKDWLNILNVKNILINYPESGTHYVDFENYDRYINYKEVAKFADGGFQLLEVPDSNLSLFSIINRNDDNFTKTITDKRDFDGIHKFANMIRSVDNSKLEYSIDSQSNYTFKSENIVENDAILFKMNYDPRWKAVDQDGKNVKLESVGPNFVMATPNNTGTVEIKFSIQTIWTEYLGILMTLGAIIFIIIFSINRRNKFID